MKQVTKNDCRAFVEPTLIRPAYWQNRAANLAAFCNQLGMTPDQITIVENNSWGRPPSPSKWSAFCLLGGTTYQYQVWAVVPKGN